VQRILDLAIRSRALRWLGILLAGTLMALLVPPMSAPDEIDHVARAELLSRGQWNLIIPPRPVNGTPADLAYFAQSGGMVDAGLIEFIQRHFSLIKNPAHRLSAADQAAIEKIRWSERRVFHPVPGTGYYFPAIYLPHAAGLAVGRALDLGVAQSYRLTRFVVLATTIGLLAWAFSLIVPPMPVVALLMLPMSLFQAISPVLDGLTVSLSLLCFGLFFRSLQGTDEDRLSRAIALALGLFVLVTTRVQLLPMLALPFLLAWRHRRPRQAILGAAAIALSATWLIVAVRATIDTRVTRTITTIDAIAYYLSHPDRLVGVLWSTVNDPNLQAFYGQSFIGVIGWLDAPLMRPFYAVLSLGLFVFIIMAASSPRSWRDHGLLRLVLIGMGLTSSLLVFFAMLVTWTPHPALQVSGVQGRYFLVPAMLVCLGLSHWTEQAPGEGPSRFRLVLWTAFTTTSVLALVQTALNRYH
jgi:uncharacterized membrane protein